MNSPAIEADIRARMAADGASPLVIAAFLRNLQRWNSGDLGVIPGASLSPLGPLRKLEDLDELSPAAEAAIGLSIILALFRKLHSINVERAQRMRG